jgi:antirestriction protein ArdC
MKSKSSKELLEDINTRVLEFHDTKNWESFLDYMMSFHEYSFGNILLIGMQYPNATHVAGFKQWKEKGRQVRRGEHAIKILGMSHKKIAVNELGEQVDKDSEEAVDEKVITWYPVLSVFDVSQTDPIDGEEDFEITLQGTADKKIRRVFVDWLHRNGYKIAFTMAPNGTSGFTSISDGVVALKRDTSEAQQLKTLVHEAAHIFLKHGQEGSDYQKDRDLCETEAESVAYVVLGALGIDTSSYSIPYISSWSDANEDILKKSASNVQRASKYFLSLFDRNTDED